MAFTKKLVSSEWISYLICLKYFIEYSGVTCEHQQPTYDAKEEVQIKMISADYNCCKNRRS